MVKGWGGAHWRCLGSSVIYGLLVFVFAYAFSHIEVMVREDLVFAEKHFGSQSSVLSMLVNFGIVLLMLWDLKHGDMSHTKHMLWLVVVSFVMTILVYGHACVMSGEYESSDKLYPWLKTEELGYLCGTVLVLSAVAIRFVIKKQEIPAERSVSNV